MQEFFPFFIILFVAVVFSRLFWRMRVPWVVSLIIGGMIVGPNGLDWFEPTRTVEFLGTIGLVFLMFIAGLESKLTDTKKLKKSIAATAALAGLVPAGVGIGIALTFGYELGTAILLGIIFMSSAIATNVPIFERQKIIKTDLAKTVIAASVIVDAVSLLLLSVFLQVATGGGLIALDFLIYPAALAVLGGFAWVLPQLKWLATRKLGRSDDLFENELQFTVMVLIGLVVFFELIGLHAIIAGFFGGMILARFMDNQVLKAKLHAISYGFFIPVFFVLIGSTTDITVFKGDLAALVIISVVVAGLLLSKFVSGWSAGRLNGFTNRSSVFIGAAVLPQLSTALAVAFLGFGEGLLDQTLLASIVGLTIVTSIISPIIVSRTSEGISRKNRQNLV